MYLYGFTIQGIQNYIFSTNKLKEIIGASEIIEKLCTILFQKHCLEFKENKNNLLLAAAGNIRYLFQDEESCKTFFADFPRIIDQEAPGIPYSQAVIKIEDGHAITENDLNNLKRKLNGRRNLPIIQPDTGVMGSEKCRRTGNVAINRIKHDGEPEFIDKITKLKDDNKDGNSLFQKLGINQDHWCFTNELNHISSKEGKNWIAVVHADGNGMGDFINTNILNSSNNISDRLRNFSFSINDATVSAFKSAFEKTFTPKIVETFETKDNVPIPPIRPVIIGGDDVTFIIRADLAIEFTRHYLAAFEENTKNNLKELGIDNGLTACAGIAFTKVKFPFHYGIHLAEQLCDFTKNRTKRRITSFHFHKIQDSLDFITIKFVWHYLSFPLPCVIFNFRSYGYAKEKCLGNRKNLKYCLYTILIIIKSIIQKI